MAVTKHLSRALQQLEMETIEAAMNFAAEGKLTEAAALKVIFVSFIQWLDAEQQRLDGTYNREKRISLQSEVAGAAVKVVTTIIATTSTMVAPGNPDLMGLMLKQVREGIDSIGKQQAELINRLKKEVR